MPDSLRLALGTLTALRVPPPRRIDRDVARGAMLWTPLVGLLLGLVATFALDGVRLLNLGWKAPLLADLLGAALAVTVLALLTRGLHLDGLVDTADGWGVKGTGEEARARRLEVMRTPEIGAFGTIAAVLVLLLQVIALTANASTGRGTISLLAATLISRLAITWAATRPVPAARGDGLGAAVAGSVPVVAAALLTVGSLLLVGVFGVIDDDRSRSLILGLVLGSVAGLVAGWIVTRRARRQLGGITGDVLGAVAEIAFTTTLVVVALLA